MGSGSRALQRTEVQQTLANLKLVLIGDTVMRSMYKDLVLHLQNSEDLLTSQEIEIKGEASFKGDKLLYCNGKLGKYYREEREYQTDFFHVKFFFVSRIYDNYMEEIFQKFLDRAPDIVVFNSCLWDITRYGPNSVDEFENRSEKLFKYLDMVLEPGCLFFWLSSLPVHSNAHKAFLLPRVIHKGHSMRLDLLEANYFVHMLCYEYERDFLDLNFHCRDLTLFHQLSDGLHWDGFANRQFSSYIVRYIADSLDIKLDARAPLIEYYKGSVIEIDTKQENAKGSPLSPESSSDWGKIRYSREAEKDDEGEFSLSNYSSHYLDSLMSGVSDLPKEYLSKRYSNHLSGSSSQSQTSPRETLDAAIKKSRVQVSYGDLFDDSPKPSKKSKLTTDKSRFDHNHRSSLKPDNRIYAKRTSSAKIRQAPPPIIRSLGSIKEQSSQSGQRKSPNFDLKVRKPKKVARRRGPKAINVPVVKDFSDASSFEEEEESTTEKPMTQTLEDDEDVFVQPQLTPRSSTVSHRSASRIRNSNYSNRYFDYSKSSSRNPFFSKFI